MQHEIRYLMQRLDFPADRLNFPIENVLLSGVPTMDGNDRKLISLTRDILML